MHLFSQAHGPHSARRRRLGRLGRLAVALAALAVAAPAEAADNHGFPRTYHIWGGWYGAQALAKYDLVIGYESNWNVGALRDLNPNGIFLLSPGLNPGEVETYDMVHLTYGAVDEWDGGNCPAPVGFVPAFDPAKDYLRRPNGSRALVGGRWRHPGFNIARPQTAEKVAKIFACAALRDGLYSNDWDGVWSDNWIHAIGRNWFFGSPLDTDLNGVADGPDYLRRRWDEGLALAGATLRELLPGKTVGGNGIWYDAAGHQGDPGSWLGEANVTQMEYQNDFYDDSGEFVELVRRWLHHPDPSGLTRYFAVEQAAMTGSGAKFDPSGDVNAPANMLNHGVMKGMRWGLTLALMAGAYFEVNPDQMHDARWWYDEYDGGVGVRERGYLGRALDAPTRLARDVWRRDFENGIALNNSRGEPVIFHLGARYRHLDGNQNPDLNDGSTVTDVKVPPHDGVILLRTGPAEPGAGAGTVSLLGVAGAWERRLARIVRARVPRRGRIVLSVRGARGARVKVKARGPHGRLLDRASKRIPRDHSVRYRLRLPSHWDKRVLKITMRARLDSRHARSKLKLRLSKRGTRIVRSVSIAP